MRGNQPKLQYHYLTLRKDKKIKDFLLFYPEFSIYFLNFRNEIHDYTSKLFKNYISCFIKKEKELKNYPYEFKVHLFNIHKNYKEELKNINQHVDKKYVIEYFNSLHESQQMHILNCKKNANVNNNQDISISA